MKLPTYIVSLDVETVGLHGQPFAWAAVVKNTQTRKVEAELIVTCPLDQAMGPPDDREWVMANVLPALEQLSPACPDLTMTTVRKVGTVEDLLYTFLIFWNAWADKNGRAWLLVDHGYPVEAEFLFETFMEGFQKRNSLFRVPYPVIDYASMRAAVGEDPVANESRLGPEQPMHNPLCDARQTLRLALKIWDSTVAVKLID